MSDIPSVQQVDVNQAGVDMLRLQKDNAIQLKNVQGLVARSATRYMWCGDAFACHCSHDIGQHSRNNEPGHGKCMSPGCPCLYFKSYRHISQEVQA